MQWFSNGNKNYFLGQTKSDSGTEHQIALLKNVNTHYFIFFFGLINIICHLKITNVNHQPMMESSLELLKAA